MMHGTATPHAAPSGATPLQEGDVPMTWQTPQATDFRFGFEITMYIAAR
jgi:pyrroloquinoline quinone biosynthesis protein A